MDSDERVIYKMLEEARQMRWTSLGLPAKNLKTLPNNIYQLQYLERLDLSYNPLVELPNEIEKLQNLRMLDIRGIQIIRLPETITNLKKLEILDVRNNDLVDLPKSIDSLSKLKKLLLSNNKLKSIPSTIGQLYQLNLLDLEWNELEEIPLEIGDLVNMLELKISNNRLVKIPNSIGNLTNITFFDFSNNRLVDIPEQIGHLKKLRSLDARNNYLNEIPDNIRKLSEITKLELANNQLKFIPDEIGRLKKIMKLDVSNNELCDLPRGIGFLNYLKKLDLQNNNLKRLPEQVGQLKNLVVLYLDNNQLRKLPPELGKIKNLEDLSVEKNPLISPPPEIMHQGIYSILKYLRGRLQEEKRQWISKLIIVGEGGVGKTQLLRSLRGKEFQTQSETTHGIEIKPLKLVHPENVKTEMLLNCWDFGGQQIYHATHQFFLTNRSLFILVWDTRHGWEAGKLYKWLETIQARAPESPVLIVAAHIDERDAELPLEDLRKRYPQIVGHYEVSNKTRVGIDALLKKLALTASNLPLMGEKWPARWLNAASEIRAKKEHYISPNKFFKIMSRYGVIKEDMQVLAQWLHELGDILYFRENEELNDLVILNPVWVTEAISKVLESKVVIEGHGIFTSNHMDNLWGDIGNTNIRQHLLRLMEQFDLSYRTLENKEISLVVERLPLDPPDYYHRWEAFKNNPNCKELSMKFSLSSLQPGLPTWFIARSHRFTTHTHWRMGALFADGEEQRHMGLVEAFEHDRYIRLTVRGPVPANFFNLLRNGLELTLERLPGLGIKRTIPCPGHEGKECQHEFNLVHVEKAAEMNRQTIECHESLSPIRISRLLYGLHESTIEMEMREISSLQKNILQQIEENKELIGELMDNSALLQRGFTAIYNSLQRLHESHCPNVFVLLPEEGKSWMGDIFRQKVILQLYCQEPGCWHPTYQDGRYLLKADPEWLTPIAPYIVKLAKVLKYTLPLACPIAGLVSDKFEEGYEHHLKLMEELTKLLGKSSKLADEILYSSHPRKAEGMQLRFFRKLLDKLDPKQEWGALQKVLTPEGHYLWLCEEHACAYRV